MTFDEAATALLDPMALACEDDDVQGGSVAQIAQVSELSESALRKVVRLYDAAGMAGLKPGKLGWSEGDTVGFKYRQKCEIQ